MTPPSSRSPSTTLALASNGELYEYVDAQDGNSPINQVVARTRQASRVIYADAPFKERGVPYVRLDTRTRWGVTVVTGR